MTNASIPVSILLVEDDPIDQKFIKRALLKEDQDLHVQVAKDGESALEVLSNGDRPRMIVTDLNMPGIGGHALLETIKTADQWKRIPTIVLSTSNDRAEIERSYDEHANAYIVKPDTVAGYSQVARLLKEFWVEAAEPAYNS